MINGFDYWGNLIFPKIYDDSALIVNQQNVSYDLSWGNINIIRFGGFSYTMPIFTEDDDYKVMICYICNTSTTNAATHFVSRSHLTMGLSSTHSAGFAMSRNSVTDTKWYSNYTGNLLPRITVVENTIFDGPKSSGSGIDGGIIYIAQLPTITRWCTPTGNVWSHSTYVYNNYVRPIGDDTHLFRCKVAGHSGTVEPTWTYTLEDEIIDGDVTWEYVGTIIRNVIYKFRTYYPFKSQLTSSSAKDGGFTCIQLSDFNPFIAPICPYIYGDIRDTTLLNVNTFYAV